MSKKPKQPEEFANLYKLLVEIIDDDTKDARLRLDAAKQFLTLKMKTESEVDSAKRNGAEEGISDLLTKDPVLRRLAEQMEDRLAFIRRENEALGQPAYAWRRTMAGDAGR